MLSEYIKEAMRRARYELLENGEGFYGEIAELPGVCANRETLEACRDELQEVLEGWLILSLSKNLPIPPLGDLSLTADRAEVACCLRWGPSVAGIQFGSYDSWASKAHTLVGITST